MGRGEADRARVAYIAWRAKPPADRQPATLGAFCELFLVGVHEIARFELEEGFDDAVVKAATDYHRTVGIVELLERTRVLSMKEGPEQAMWMEAYVGLVSPALLQSNPFAAFKERPSASPGNKPRAARR